MFYNMLLEGNNGYCYPLSVIFYEIEKRDCHGGFASVYVVMDGYMWL